MLQSLFAQDHDDFIRLIDVAKHDYSTEKIEKRMLMASKNTWGDRVREFWEIIDVHLEKKATKIDCGLAAFAQLLSYISRIYIHLLTVKYVNYSFDFYVAKVAWLE